MAESNFLFTFLVIAILILIIQGAQYLAKIASIPQVLGEILAGIIIGPSILNMLSLVASGETLFEKFDLASSTEIETTKIAILFLAEIAGLLLLFEVGLEIDTRLLKQVGRESISTALGGILIPFTAGLGYILLFSSHFDVAEFHLFDVGLFLGTTLTATSIGISIRVLIEMGRFDTKTTRIMIGAAIIDDILALLLFSLILGYVKEEEASKNNQIEEMFLILFGIATFFIIIILIDYVFSNVISDRLRTHPDRYLVLSVTLFLIFFLAWLAGTLYLAPIIGAFLAGVVIGRNRELSSRSQEQITPIARWLVPFFFIAVGMRIDLGLISNFTSIGLALTLSVFAIFSKVVGSGIGAFIHDKSNNIVDALEVGVGMSPRGEVILLIATAALDIGVFNATLYALIVVTVAISAVVAPLILRYLVTLPSSTNNSTT
jgi:Kef-type K+ transport system membrane component KefB